MPEVNASPLAFVAMPSPPQHCAECALGLPCMACGPVEYKVPEERAPSSPASCGPQALCTRTRVPPKHSLGLFATVYHAADDMGHMELCINSVRFLKGSPLVHSKASSNAMETGQVQRCFPEYHVAFPNPSFPRLPPLLAGICKAFLKQRGAEDRATLQRLAEPVLLGKEVLEELNSCKGCVQKSPLLLQAQFPVFFVGSLLTVAEADMLPSAQGAALRSFLASPHSPGGNSASGTKQPHTRETRGFYKT